MFKKIFIGIIVAGLVVGCDLDRQPLTGPSTGGFPNNADEAFWGLMGAYKGLSLMDAANTPWLLVVDNLTDTGVARAGNNYTPSYTSSYAANNTLTSKLWRVHYKAIGRVHLVLDNLEALREELGEDTYLMYDAELRFIRAYVYQQLTEFYGDIPLFTRQPTLEECYEITRTPKAEVTQFLIDELEEIKDNLPESHPGYGTGRATNVGAYHLLARIALYDERWQLAWESASKAMELAEGTYGMDTYDTTPYPDHTYGEPDCTNVFGYEGHANSPEWIFCIQYNKLISSNDHQQAYYMLTRLGGGCSYWGPTQNLIDMFQCTDGLSIDQSPMYDPAKPFLNRDPRLDLFCVRPGSRQFNYEFQTIANTSAEFYLRDDKGVVTGSEIRNGYVTSYMPDPSTPTGYVGGVINTSSAGDNGNNYSAPSGYLWRKHTDIVDMDDNTHSDLNSGVLRYSELPLIYAEAKIEANSIDQSVYDEINRIRNRAGMPSLSTGMTQVQLRKAIRYERTVEMCNEALRWYDIRRWKIAPNVISGPLYTARAVENPGVTPTFDESHCPAYPNAGNLKIYHNMVFNPDKDYVWPIPQNERDLMPNLTQNNGY